VTYIFFTFWPYVNAVHAYFLSLLYSHSIPRHFYQSLCTSLSFHFLFITYPSQFLHTFSFSSFSDLYLDHSICFPICYTFAISLYLSLSLSLSLSLFSLSLTHKHTHTHAITQTCTHAHTHVLTGHKSNEDLVLWYYDSHQVYSHSF